MAVVRIVTIIVNASPMYIRVVFRAEIWLAI